MKKNSLNFKSDISTDLFKSIEENKELIEKLPSLFEKICKSSSISYDDFNEGDREYKSRYYYKELEYDNLDNNEINQRIYNYIYFPIYGGEIKLKKSYYYISFLDIEIKLVKEEIIKKLNEKEKIVYEYNELNKLFYDRPLFFKLFGFKTLFDDNSYEKLQKSFLRKLLPKDIAYKTSSIYYHINPEYDEIYYLNFSNKEGFETRKEITKEDYISLEDVFKQEKYKRKIESLNSSIKKIL